jgi:hypothetical protein
VVLQATRVRLQALPCCFDCRCDTEAASKEDLYLSLYLITTDSRASAETFN